MKLIFILIGVWLLITFFWGFIKVLSLVFLVVIALALFKLGTDNILNSYKTKM